MKKTLKQTQAQLAGSIPADRCLIARSNSIKSRKAADVMDSIPVPVLNWTPPKKRQR